jgi:UDP-N-acetylglucosamine 3-dehydrogenase
MLVVGLGRQGRRHARVAANTGLARVVATVDPRPGPLAGVPHHPTIEEALAALPAAERPEVAVVASPIEAHGDQVRALVLAGIPTLVEKPVTGRAEDAEALAKLAIAEGVLVAVGHVERFNPCVQLVRAMLEKGSLGRPVACSFRRVGLPPPTRPDHDVIHDLAVHDIDVFNVLVGPPHLVGASGWVGPDGLVESAHVLLRSGDVHGLVEVNWRTPVRLRSFTITTEECLVQVDYTTQSVEVVEASQVQDFDEFASFRSHYGAARRTQLEARVAEPLAEQLAAFVSAARGEPRPELATLRDGGLAVDLATQASAAAADRAPRHHEVRT